MRLCEQRARCSAVQETREGIVIYWPVISEKLFHPLTIIILAVGYNMCVCNALTDVRALRWKEMWNVFKKLRNMPSSSDPLWFDNKLRVPRKSIKAMIYGVFRDLTVFWSDRWCCNSSTILLLKGLWWDENEISIFFFSYLISIFHNFPSYFNYFSVSRLSPIKWIINN